MDQELGRELLMDAKNRTEHNYVVDYIAQRMSKVATDIQVGSEPRIQKLHNVQHLHTPITGQLLQPISALSIIELFHPTPAVGGIPIPEALNFIKTYETEERGYFAGPLGWMALNDDMDVIVGIRSGLLSTKKILVWAGAGIVQNSDPETEYEELLLKLKPVLSAIRYSATNG